MNLSPFEEFLEDFPHVYLKIAPSGLISFVILQMKSKYLEETRKSAENLELRQSEAAAWSATYKKLWREFQCCYYTCNGLVFNAIGEDYIFEIYELAQEIAAPPTIPLPVERKSYNYSTVIS